MTKQSILYFILGLILWGCLHCTPALKPILLDDVAPYASAATFQLAAPNIKSGQALFDDHTTVELTLPLDGTQLRYTLDGSTPTASSKIYTAPLFIDQTCALNVQAFHPDFQPSTIVKKQFVKLSPPIAIKQINLNREPHENYPGSGAKGLMDRQKGSTNFRTNHWMGFNGGELTVDIALQNKQLLKMVTVSLLSDQGSWIFLPENIIIQTSADGKNYVDLVRHKLALTKMNSSPELVFTTIPIPETNTKYLRITIIPANGIPNWHPGKGTPPWLFIDEILLDPI